MEWYEIVIGVVCWVIGFWILMKYQDFRKYDGFNSTFKSDLKKRKKRN
jgi:hypothetical protein